MAEKITSDAFYTLDEEKRTLVPTAIHIGDGFKLIMQISKKYITGDTDDEDQYVNIDIGNVSSITTSLQRKTTRDYLQGNRDATSFSRGHVIGNGRMVCPVLDRELISFIFTELEENAPDNKVFDLIESNTFGAVFEVEEETETTINQDKTTLVGGTDSTFSKDKEYIYLDDIPIFNLRFLARADTDKNIVVHGEALQSDNFKVGAIYQRLIQRVRFAGDSSSVNADDPISNQVIDFVIFGNDSGWKPLD